MARGNREGVRVRKRCGNANHRRQRDDVSRAPRRRDKTGTAPLKGHVRRPPPPLRPPDPTSARFGPYAWQPRGRARAQACGNGNHRRHRDHVSRAPRWREKTGTAQLKRRVLCTAPPLRPPDPTSTAMARGNQEGARAHKRAEMETIDDTAMT